MGPMTGRAAGYCAGYSVPGFMNPVGGRGMGRGMGAGRGWGRGYRFGGAPGWTGMDPGYGPAYGSAYGPAWGVPAEAAYGPPASPEQEKQYLKQQVDFLEKQAQDARGRLAELEEEEGSS